MKITLSFIFLWISIFGFAQKGIISPKSDHNYYQTFKQVVDSSCHFNFNVDSAKWFPAEKLEYSYDTMGVLLSRVVYDFNETQDQYTAYEKLDINKVNDSTEISEYFLYQGNNWIEDYRSILHIYSDSSYVFDSIQGIYINNYYTTHSFNEDDSIEISIEYCWDSTLFQWQKYIHSEYQYSVNRKVKWESYWDTASMNWMYLTKYVYSLSTQDRIDTIQVFHYDTATSQWYEEQLLIHKYHDNLLSSITIQKYDAGKGFVNFTKDSNRYDENNQLIETLRLEWNNATEKYFFVSRNQYQYNDLGNLVQDVFLVWDSDNNAWVYNYKSEYYLSDFICTLEADLHVSESISCHGYADGQISVSIDGGTTPYEIFWQDTLSIDTVLENVMANQYYHVSIKDRNQCESEDSILLSEPEPLEANLEVIEPVSCFGYHDGKVKVEVSGGTGEHFYSWNDGDLISSDSLANLSPGVYYSVRIMDENDCQLKDSIILSEPEKLLAEITSQTHVSCHGGNDGAVIVAANGGTAPYQYYWEQLQKADSAVSGLFADSIYFYEVTDTNGCQYQDSILLSQPGPLSGILLDSANVSCFGGNDGYFRIAATGGIAPYSYFWEELEDHDSMATELQADIYYHYLITDKNDCEFRDSIILAQPGPVLTPDIQGLNVVNYEDEVEYTVEAASNSKYHWDMDGGEILYGNGTDLVLVQWTVAGDGEMRVVEENAAGCFGDTARYLVVVWMDNGISGFDENDIHLYPNPFSEVLNIELNQGVELDGYQIFDLSGRIVRKNTQAHRNKVQIYPGDMEKGMYYLKLISERPVIFKIIHE